MTILLTLLWILIPRLGHYAGWSTSLCTMRPDWTRRAFEFVRSRGLLRRTILLLVTSFGLFLLRTWPKLAMKGRTCTWLLMIGDFLSKILRYNHFENSYIQACSWRFENSKQIFTMGKTKYNSIKSIELHWCGFLIRKKQIRDQALSRLKSKIELMYVTNGHKKVVVVPHSMGVIYFLHFMKWVESPPPMGGGGGPDWCAKHIKAVMNIGPAFLGVPKAVSSIFSAEGKDVSFLRLVSAIHPSYEAKLWYYWTSDYISLDETSHYQKTYCILTLVNQPAWYGPAQVLRFERCMKSYNMSC